MRRARDFVMGQIDLGLESTDNQMNWIGEQWLGYRRIYTPQHVKRRLHQVTAAAVRSAARDFFRPDRLNLAIVSPLKSPAGLESALQV
jgi:predicted Zn-dependent peptidase